jgi:polysaccharide pyruvyl transferase WcaK-like protein
VTVRSSISRRNQSIGAPRIGLFGNLGSQNIGNDGSMESVLRYLRNEHPDATVDAMCAGPERLKAAYGIEAIPLSWYDCYEQRVPGVMAPLLKVLGKGVDVIRIASWARNHEVIIVPGMGVLESTLPLRPWQLPYSMFLLCAAGKIFGTKVALVSVGADIINKRATRWLSN